MIFSAHEIIGKSMYTMRRAGAVICGLVAKALVSRTFIIDLEARKPTVESEKLFAVFQALGHEIALRGRETGGLRW
jgi:hypothetical protein